MHLHTSHRFGQQQIDLGYMSAVVRSGSGPGGVSGDPLISDGQSCRIRSTACRRRRHNRRPLSKITILITNAATPPPNAQSETDRQTDGSKSDFDEPQHTAGDVFRRGVGGVVISFIAHPTGLHRVGNIGEGDAEIVIGILCCWRLIDPLRKNSCFTRVLYKLYEGIIRWRCFDVKK